MTHRNGDHGVFALGGMVMMVTAARLLSFCGLRNSSVRVQCPGTITAVRQAVGQSSISVGLVTHQSKL